MKHKQSAIFPAAHLPFHCLACKYIAGCFCPGVSAEAIRLADATAYIPMSGFVSSFNVSVAAALVFYEARRARLQHMGHHCDLTDHDKQVLTAVMLLRHQVKPAMLAL